MFSNLKLIIFALAFIILDLLAPSILLGFQPLMPLKDNVDHLPLIELSLREPRLLKDGISDDIYFEQSFERVKELEKELRLYKGNNKASAYKRLYETYLQMAYFLEDVQAKRTTQAANYTNIEKKIRNLRSRAVAYATSYSKLTKNKQLRSNALYHAFVSSYLNGSNQAQQISYLSNIRQHLSPYLQRRADFIINYHKLFSREKESARLQLKSLIKTLPPEGAIAARLALAKSYAGLSRTGKRLSKPEAIFSSYLRAAGQTSRRLSHVDKDFVLSYSTGIWRRASGNLNWVKFPIQLAYFAESNMVDSIKERIALDHLSKKKYPKAISIYASLSERYQDKPLMLAIDKRLISIYERSDKHSRPEVYENALVRLKEKYQEKNATKEHQLMLNMIRSRYKNLADERARLAFKSKKIALIQTAIEIRNRYISTYQITGQEYLANQEITAKLYIAANQLHVAVDIYQDLSDRAERPQDKIKYLRLAIGSQSILSKWASIPPWQGFPTGMKEQRIKLLSLYEKALGVSNHWNDAAHLGLLHTSIGSNDKAFDIWLTQLKSQAKHKQAEFAAGYMAHMHQKQKQWASLEGLLRITIKEGIRLRYRKTVLNERRLMADALFYGGKENFTVGNYTSARDKLKEFSESFSQDPRMDQALVLLARAYHHSNDHVASINTIISIIERFPNSRYKKQALLYGAEWAVPMAYEDHAMSFYQTFLDEFPRDSRRVSVIDKLIPLYLGRGIFSQARELYLEKSKDAKISKQDQIAAAVNAMELEERYGDMNTAQMAAIRVRSIAGNDSRALSRVFAFEIRKAISEDNTKKVQALERKLTDLAADGSREDIEAIAEARLFIAKAKLAGIEGKIFNLELKNPKAVLEKRYSSFKAIESDFKRVCEVGTTSFCPLAMMELSKATTSLAEGIDDITIPETLTENQVEAFKRLKLSILDDLNEVSTNADDSALELSESGETIPDYSQAVLWDNHEEWNYESSNPSPGNGYIQWSTGGLKMKKNK